VGEGAWTLVQFSVTSSDGAPYKFAHWADLPLAQAWIDRAYAMASGPLDAQLETQPYAQQLTAVRELFAALSGAYLALNVPPFSSPEWLTTATKWLRSLAAENAANVTARVVGRSTQTTYHSEMADRLRSLWIKTTGADLQTGTGGEACDAWARIILGSDGRVVEWCTESAFEPGGCGPAGYNAGCANDWRSYYVNGKLTVDQIYAPCRPDGPGASYLTRYSWRTLAWRKSDDTGAGRAAPTFCALSPVSLPLRWYWEMAREVAAALHASGARGAILHARTYVTSANARTARDEGLLNNAALIDAAAHVATDVQRYGKDDPNIQKASASLALLATVVAAIPAVPYSQIAAAIIGVTAAVLRELPLATGIRTDPWGRAVPVFLEAFISADPAANNLPTHSVEKPAGYVTPTTSDGGGDSATPGDTSMGAPGTPPTTAADDGAPQPAPQPFWQTPLGVGLIVGAAGLALDKLLRAKR
jgi:hypothetical protein